MTHALFDRVKAHIVKPTTIKDGAGWTFCGRETNTRVDIWQESTGGLPTCAVCYRAERKSRGIRPEKNERRELRKKGLVR